MTPSPPPGSDKAIALGCTCPVLDNAHGRGVPTKDGPMFWITVGCPLHCPPDPPADKGLTWAERAHGIDGGGHHDRP